MKKIMGLMAAAMLSAVLLGCPQMNDLLSQRDDMQRIDPPADLGAFSAAPSLVFVTGDVEDGDINYSWTPAVARDVKKPVIYTLFVAQGAKTAPEILADVDKTAIAGSSRGLGIFYGKPGVHYSAVVIASQDGVSIESNVAEADGKPVTEEGGNPDAPVFSAAPDLTWQTGTTDGQIAWLLTPAALVSGGDSGVTYTLYAAKGEPGKAALLLTGGTVQTAASGVYTGDKGAVYSAVIAATSGGVTVYSRVRTAAAKAEYDLRFGVISDVYIGADKHGTEDFSAVDRLEKALQWYQTQDGVSAVAITGNIIDGEGGVETRMKTQWNAAKNVFSKYTGGDKPRLIAVMGSREALQAAEINGGGTSSRAGLFTEYTGQSPNARYVINGYHCITVNAGGSITADSQPVGGAEASAVSEGSPDETGDLFSAPVRDWLRTQLNAAQTAAPGKPIFVFMHWPLQDTVYVSEDTGTRRYTTSFGEDPAASFFNAWPQAVVFSGHTRSPNSDPRSIWQGGFTAVNAGTLLSYEMESGYLGGTTPIEPQKSPRAASDAAATGMIVTVKGSQVTITNHDFDPLVGGNAAVTQTSQTWSFDAAAPAQFPYTAARRAAQKTMPVFDQAAAADAAVPGKITISSRRDEGSGKMGFTAVFEQAVIPAPNAGNEAVHHYEFELKSSLTGMSQSLGKQWSDFMLPARLRQSSYTQSFTGVTMEPGSEYELIVYAVGSLGERSTQYLTGTFTAPGVFNPIEYRLAFNGSLNNAANPELGLEARPDKVYSFKRGNTAANPRPVTDGTEVYEAGLGGKQSLKVDMVNGFIRLDDNRSGNGSNNVNTSDSTTAFNYNQSFTIAFWVKVNSAGLSGNALVLFSNKSLGASFGNGSWLTGGNPSGSGNNGRTGKGLAFYIDGSGNTRSIKLNSSDGTEAVNGANGILIKDNVLDTWVHVAAVYDTTGGTNGQVRYYADGAPVGSANIDLRGGMNGGFASYIGSSGGNNNELYTRINGGGADFRNYTMNCNIQDFILKGGTMTDAQVAGLGTAPFNSPTLTAAPSYLPGSISYTWTDMSPATYQLYVAPGVLSAAALKVPGNLQSGVTGTSHIFTGTAGSTYSAIVVATRGAQTVESTVVTAAASSTASRTPNLALNKPVAAVYVGNAVTHATHPPTMAVDGTVANDSRWAVTSNPVAVPIMLEVAIDNNSGTALDVNEFKIVAYGTTGDATGRIQKFNVEYWDGSAWQIAYSRTDTSQIPGSTDGSKSFSAVFQSGTVNTTKIRLNIISASAEPSIWEFELYWDPTHPPPAPLTAPSLNSLTTPTSGRGRLDYSWTTAQEPAVQYTLYHKKGSFTDAASIISGGTATAISTATGSGTLTGLDAGATYSAVIAARRGSSTVYSSVRSAASSNSTLSDDNTLSSFSVSGGTGVLMRPTFNAQIVDYTLIVPYNYSGGAITLTAAANNANATLGAGQGSQTISLTGNGQYTVTVTAQDGTTKTYTLHVPKVYTVEGVEFKMNYVPGGRFQRDATATNITVVENPLRAAETEVTWGLFAAVMGKKKSGSVWEEDTAFTGKTGGPTASAAVNPVGVMSFYVAVAFCNKLSVMLGKTPVYAVSTVPDWGALAWSDIPINVSTSGDPGGNGNADWNNVTCDWTADGFRLPTEWEFLWGEIGADVTAPGTVIVKSNYTSVFAGQELGLTAAQSVQSGVSVGAVASKAANALGLYDMSGNLQEFCWDRAASSNNNTGVPWPGGTKTTGEYRGHASNAQRTLKGGSYNQSSTNVTNFFFSDRGTPHWARYGSNGFRIWSND
jgi:formylglycine-generating enzyme required for sulfatase activity